MTSEAMNITARKAASRALAKQRLTRSEPTRSRARLSVDSRVSDGNDAPKLQGEPIFEVLHPAALGPYRVLEPLGQGGMGVVYRARHAVTARAVAIKTVRASAPRWLDSIRREVDALTRMRHPGIVRIIDHGEHEGRPWYAMDLLEGESLRDFCARIWSSYRTPSAPPGPLRALTATAPVTTESEESESDLPVSPQPHGGNVPAAAGALPQVLAFMRRLCATLAFLHGEGLVSCDLKPENVVLAGPIPVLIDFGIARRFPGASGREAMDSQSNVAGTLPYMSPEQARGELVDARSDLYSVGCILYELLTGAPPFIGTPFSVRSQHQSAAPTPPSRHVQGVPLALEALVLRLLEKQPNHRVGFADEVAAELAQIGNDTQRLHDFPPARPYLYRSRFVGQEIVLARLSQLRDAACRGCGALALLAGESGLGKTRLALELARTSANSGVRIIASEAPSILPDHSGTAIGAAPLHVVRSLLRAIADRCQEGGAEITEKLLGVRRSVLAQYEPLLAQVPALNPAAPVVPLAPEAARQRVLRYVAQSLVAFAEEQPILWLIDDLGWADELSLAFLHSLGNDYLSTTPALLVGTYRSEEASASEEIQTLSSQPHVVHLVLKPLLENDVASMVADMLATPKRHTGFAEFVAEVAEGNPFFVTEQVRTAVSERLFYRDHDHTWQMRQHTAAEQASFEALPLPGSLLTLVERRLRRLTPIAQAMAQAAAVIGRVSNVEVLEEIAGFSKEAASAAIDELVRRQVFEQSGPEHLRFMHDKLREVAYRLAGGGAPSIHARAAFSLERRFGEEVERAAELGNHFAAASEHERAAHYLKRAADHARSNFANLEAIALYRRAIEQVGLLSGESADIHLAPRLDLQEALGDVLALGGERAAARTAFSAALEVARSPDTVRLSRLRRKLGKTWEAEGDHQQALSLYARARESLTTATSIHESNVRDEWIHTRLDELRANYWLERQTV